MAKNILGLILILSMILAFSSSALADTIGTVSGDAVNIRSGPATTYDIIDSASGGDTYNILNLVDNWYHIRLPGGIYGYISADYMDKTTNQTLPATVRPLSSAVNIRAEASIDAALIGSFSGSQVLDVSGETEYWYQVNYQNQVAYVAKWLVMANYQTPLPAEGNIFATAIVNNDTLNFRDAPDGELLGVLERDMRLYVRQAHDDWYEVDTPLGRGFVHGAYLLFDNGQSIATDTSRQLEFSFKGTTAQGEIDLDFTEEDYGFYLELDGNTLINYQFDYSSNSLEISTDMEIKGELPTANDFSFSLGGDFNNNLIISADQPLYYRLDANENKTALELSIGLSPLIGKIIVIDPGHGSYEDGGLDPGATVGDLYEKDIVYDMALYIQQILGDRGATVLLSRGEEAYTTLAERAAQAAADQADILVSVHVNAATSSAASGSSTWLYAPENDDNYDREKRLLLAETIQRNLLAEGGLVDYGIREANFTILRHSTMPAVLVETAFITNPGDYALLLTDQFRYDAAYGISLGIIDYFMEV